MRCQPCIKQLPFAFFHALISGLSRQPCRAWYLREELKILEKIRICLVNRASLSTLMDQKKKVAGLPQDIR
jgi:hypothetical protein